MAARRLSPLFKLAFFTLLGLTLLLIAAGVAYSIFIPNPTKSQTNVENHLFGIATLTGD